MLVVNNVLWNDPVINNYNQKIVEKTKEFYRTFTYLAECNEAMETIRLLEKDIEELSELLKTKEE